MEDPKTMSLKERLSDTYYLIVRHEDTFSEVGSYRLSLLKVYLLGLGLLFSFLLLAMAIFFFTPLRTLVPGYGQIEDQTAFIQLKKDYKELDSQVQAQQTYITAVRRLLTDDPEYIEDVIGTDSAVDLSQTEVEKIKEDSVFREKIENEEELRDVRSLLGQNVEIDQEKRLDQAHFTPPVKGEITAKFMPENRHFGVDIMAPSNTPILATLDGLVITSDWTLETGHTLGILHDNNLVSFYKHNSANLKRTGDLVKAGEAVAIIGNSGTLTTGPHLHFELWIGDKAVDPAEYVIFQ